MIIIDDCGNGAVDNDDNGDYGDDNDDDDDDDIYIMMQCLFVCL